MRACVVLVVVLFTAVCTNASSPLQPDAPKHQEHSTAIQPVSLYLIDECNHLDHLSDDSDEADLSVEREALGQPDEPRVACAKASSLFDALKDAGKGFLKRAFSFKQQKKERSQEQDAILRGERHVYESTPELRGALATSSPPASPSPSQSTSLVEVANPVLRSPARLWPHGVIPFYFKQESPRSFFEAVEMTGFIRAAAELTRETNLRVVPVARPDRFDSADVVEVRTSDKLIGGECSSPVGRRGRVQGLIITDMCFKSASLHELLHTAGFTHTHARQDRDAYVTYRPDNMADPTEGYNFDKTNPEYWKDVGPFSLDSIMLYGTHSFSKSIFHPTLMPKFGWSKGSWKELGLPAPIDSWLRLQGFRTKLGEADIDAVNQVYPPDETPLSEIEAFKSGALKVDEAAQARKSATYRIAKIISQHELVFDPDSKVQLGMWKTVEEALQKKSVATFNAIAAVINKAAKERPSARAYEVVIADQGPAENKMYATLRGGFIADMFKQAGVKVSAARPPLLYHLRCSGVEHEGVWSCNNHARGDGIPSVRVFVLKPRADVLTPATQAPST